jgi:hypothetical protein
MNEVSKRLRIHRVMCVQPKTHLVIAALHYIRRSVLNRLELDFRIRCQSGICVEGETSFIINFSMANCMHSVMASLLSKRRINYFAFWLHFICFSLEKLSYFLCLNILKFDYITVRQFIF